MGIFPGYMFGKMQGSVDLLVDNLMKTTGLVEAARQISGM